MVYPRLWLVSKLGSPLLAGASENSSEPESRSLENRTEPAPVCTPEGRWCPRSNICLPLDAPCHPQTCANGSTSGPGLPGVSYALWREFLFSVPAGPPAQYSVCVTGLSPFCLPLSCLRSGSPHQTQTKCRFFCIAHWVPQPPMPLPTSGLVCPCSSPDMKNSCPRAFILAAPSKDSPPLFVAHFFLSFKSCLQCASEVSSLSGEAPPLAVSSLPCACPVCLRLSCLSLP